MCVCVPVYPICVQKDKYACVCIYVQNTYVIIYTRNCQHNLSPARGIWQQWAMGEEEKIIFIYSPLFYLMFFYYVHVLLL